MLPKRNAKPKRRGQITSVKKCNIVILRNIPKLHKGFKSISVYIYNASLASILIGLLFSRAMINIGFISFAANWIIESNYKEKWLTFKENKSPTIISLIFFIYLAGVSYTSSLDDALSNIKTKAYLLLPVFYFSLTNLRNKIKLNYLITLFIVAVVVKTVILYTEFQLQVDYSGIEDLYKINFPSNIRLALFVVMSIFCLLYFNIIQKNGKTILKLASLLSTVWLIYFLYFLNSLTGYIILAVILLFVLYLYLRNNFQKKHNILFISATSIIISLSAIYITHAFIGFQKHDNINFSTLPYTTVNGNLYEHDTLSKFTECGHYTDIYVCKKEMEQEWNKKSSIPFFGKDLRGQNLDVTLKRYLSSKNLTKDSVGISKLSNEDVKYIENGYANYLYTKKYSIKSKLYLIWWQLNAYDITGDAGNQSISQRIEYYKISFKIIKDNLWFGVGTGALLNETLKAFKESNSKTDNKYWYLVHNQFVYVLASFGILGFMLFVVLFFFPLLKPITGANSLFTGFYLIILLSLFTDNTFEVQLGLGFFVVFYCLLGDYGNIQKT